MIRVILLSIGIVSLVLGFLGLFLPLLPTTPFVLLSAWCFMRSSPRFHTWLLNHRTLGPLHADWVKRGAIPRSGKKIAIGMILLSLTSIWLCVDLLPLKIGVTALLVCVSTFILTRPN
jgi:uncharacterized membrane protein YbaN (DUF454 family)